MGFDSASHSDSPYNPAGFYSASRFALRSVYLQNYLADSNHFLADVDRNLDHYFAGHCPDNVDCPGSGHYLDTLGNVVVLGIVAETDAGSFYYQFVHIQHMDQLSFVFFVALGNDHYYHYLDTDHFDSVLHSGSILCSDLVLNFGWI